MLGRFLELALVVEDPGASWQRYQELGFASAETGDVWKHAYGVVACRGVALGLHALGEEPNSIVFVRPDVATLHRDLVEREVPVEQARLGSEVFNELSLREPGGCRLRVLEARSFSPPPGLPQSTRFGSFRSLSLPCRDLSGAADFWRRTGFTVEESDEPWEGLRIPGTPLSYHLRRALPEPALLFQSAGMHADALEDQGLQRESALAALDGLRHDFLRTDEGLAVILL